MRCLIFGATGQVGGRLVEAAADREWTTFGTTYRQIHPDFISLDLRDTEAIEDLLDDAEPDVVFLPAAQTHMDNAERNPAECEAVNLEAVVEVAHAVAARRGKLVFFSTDHVFGECPYAMTEEDPTAPISVYAKTKVAAEVAIREILPNNHVILRTSWVYGPETQGKNFAYSVSQRLASGETITAANDQYGQPTFGPDLAEIAMELVKLEQSGTFHAVGPDRLTKFCFARLIAHIMGYDADLVQPIKTSAMNQVAPRPGKVWLDRHKLKQLLGANVIRKPGEGLRVLRGILQNNRVTEPVSMVA